MAGSRTRSAPAMTRNTTPTSIADALHAETRRLLSLAVTMPRRTAEIDDALDRWLLHPVFGPGGAGAW